MILLVVLLFVSFIRDISFHSFEFHSLMNIFFLAALNVDLLFPKRPNYFKIFQVVHLHAWLGSGPTVPPVESMQIGENERRKMRLQQHHRVCCSYSLV